MPDNETPEPIPSAFLKGLNYWKLGIAKATGKMLAAGANSLITTLNGVQWNTFTDSQKLVALLTMGIAMWQVMDAFLNNTMASLTAAEKAQIAHETT